MRLAKASVLFSLAVLPAAAASPRAHAGPPRTTKGCLPLESNQLFCVQRNDGREIVGGWYLWHKTVDLEGPGFLEGAEAILLSTADFAARGFELRKGHLRSLFGDEDKKEYKIERRSPAAWMLTSMAFHEGRAQESSSYEGPYMFGVGMELYVTIKDGRPERLSFWAPRKPRQSISYDAFDAAGLLLAEDFLVDRSNGQVYALDFPRAGLPCVTLALLEAVAAGRPWRAPLPSAPAVPLERVAALEAALSEGSRALADQRGR